MPMCTTRFRCSFSGSYPAALVRAGFDAATLWAASLKVPAVAGRIVETRKHELMSHSGRVAAGILASEHDETRRAAARACAEWLLSHPPSQHS